MAAKSEALSIGVLHGPNLSELGRREPRIYGLESLDEIDRRLSRRASELGARLATFQSNTEGAIVDWVHEAGPAHDGLLVNAAAFTHTSIAIRDALATLDKPFVEVHLSNVFAREPFRHHSYLADLAIGLVCGFGAESYLLALEGLLAYLRRE